MMFLSRSYHLGNSKCLRSSVPEMGMKAKWLIIINYNITSLMTNKCSMNSCWMRKWGKKNVIYGNSLKLWYLTGIYNMPLALVAFLILIAMHGMLNTPTKSGNINFLEKI